jgi:hypothetical protein
MTRCQMLGVKYFVNLVKNKNMNEFYDLEHKIAANPRLDFGTIFSQSFELFKVVWGKGALFMVFYFLGVMGLVTIFTLPASMMGASFDAMDMANSEFGLVAGIAFFIFVLLLFVALITLVTGLMAGFYLGCKKADEGEEFSTTNYFVFFEGRHLKRTVGVALATFGVIFLSALLCYFPIIYTAVPVGYFVVIYAYNPHLTTTEIVKLSFKLGTNKWGITLGLTFVLLLLAYFGAIITCGIGIVFTFSIILLPKYYIYKGVIGFDTADILDEIGQDSQFDNL